MAVPSNPGGVSLSSTPQQNAASHRLPTVSASQALQSLHANGSAFLPTGIKSLDALLSSTSNDVAGGLARGKLTELWGPSGSGKTAIALQTAANLSQAGSRVLWLDAKTPLSAARLSSTCTSTSSPDSLELIRRVHVPTLSHLLSLALQPSSDSFTSVGLLVVDGLNFLIDLDYPRSQPISGTRTEQQKWQAGRRYAILGCLSSALNKLAVLNNLAVLVTTGCSTRMRADSGLGAALAPGIGGAEWDAAIWNRLVIFRDFTSRCVGVQKCAGKSLLSREEVGEVGKVVGFEIAADGCVRERQPDRAVDHLAVEHAKARSSPIKPRKRNFDEVADSEDEDVDEYGWADDDDKVFVTDGLINQAEVGTEIQAQPT